MNAKHEYEFLGNFKILQNVFKAKKIDKVCRISWILPRPIGSNDGHCEQPIPVDKLVKCKMQCVLLLLYFLCARPFGNVIDRFLRCLHQG
jgi:microtubule-associated protein, RP/EB family